jgi:hypothetical protein
MSERILALAGVLAQAIHWNDDGAWRLSFTHSLTHSFDDLSPNTKGSDERTATAATTTTTTTTTSKRAPW